MRRGELLALRWRNVDLDGKIIRVREALEETKTGLRFKGPKFWAGLRDISLPAILLDVLHEHRMAQLERRLMLGQGKLGDGALVFPRWDDSEQGRDRCLVSRAAAHPRQPTDRRQITAIAKRLECRPRSRLKV
jgi:integrase